MTYSVQSSPSLDECLARGILELNSDFFHPFVKNQTHHVKFNIACHFYVLFNSKLYICILGVLCLNLLAIF